MDVLTLDLPAVANAATKTALAILTLIAAALVFIGLVRAWVGRRSPQVVLSDVVAVEGLPAAAVSGLSPLLRHAVRQALFQQSANASYAVVNTLERDAMSGLLRVHGRMQVTSAAHGLRSTVEDSLTTLAAGVRALAPKEAEGLTAMIASALPPQRGWAVRTFPLIGGSDGRKVGLSLEFAPLGRAADSVTTFWVSGPPSEMAADGSAQAVATGALLQQLIEPASLWIAIRLVARQLAQTGQPTWRRFTPTVWSGREIGGLQMQLAGQLSLYAIENHDMFDRGFAEQALADLVLAKQKLPDYFRPYLTEAAVRERLGYSHRRAGLTQEASEHFLRAVHEYDVTVTMLQKIAVRNVVERDAALARARVRRAKCRLLTSDVGQMATAERELRELAGMTGTEALELYNGACTFAVAVATPELAESDRKLYLWHAWRLLGLALLAGGREGPWRLAVTDPDLDALDLELRNRYCDALKRWSANASEGEHSPVERTAEEKAQAKLQAEALVAECLAELGVSAGDEQRIVR